MYEIKDLTTGQTYSKLNLNSVRSMLKVNQNTVYKAVYENKKQMIDLRLSLLKMRIRKKALFLRVYVQSGIELLKC